MDMSEPFDVGTSAPMVTRPQMADIGPTGAGGWTRVTQRRFAVVDAEGVTTGAWVPGATPEFAPLIDRLTVGDLTD